MKTNVRKGLSSLTAVPLFIAIVIAVNLIGLFFFTRFDVTDERIYSLSDASKNLARAMDDPVVCKLYFSEDIPAPYNAYARYLKDQLYEYRAYSRGQLRFEFIDPTKSNREKEAQALGIPPLQVQAIEKDKMELKKVYMGLAFLYEDKKEVIPVVQSTRNLEYEISSAIRKVTSKEVPVVGILAGHGEHGQNAGLDVVWQSLEKLYQPRQVHIAPGQLIDPQVATLLIVGPADSVSKWDQYAIDQFLMRGGKLAVFYDPVETDFQNSRASDRASNWEEFLAKYGISIERALVIDAHCARIGVTQQQGYLRFQNVVEYPYMPDIRLFNPNHLVGKDLEGVDFPFVSPLDSTRVVGTGLTFTPICWTSERSGLKHAPYDVNPMQKLTAVDFAQPRQIIAASISGHFSSAFLDGPPPDTSVGTATLPPTIKEIADNRIVVVGDADCATDQATRNPANAAFVLNIVDWLSQEEGLITIRSRDVSARPLEEVSDGTRQTVKYANVFGPPLLVIIFGLWRWQVRRRHKAGTHETI